jgi:hypothetical protein
MVLLETPRGFAEEGPAHDGRVVQDDVRQAGGDVGPHVGNGQEGGGLRGGGEPLNAVCQEPLMQAERKKGEEEAGRGGLRWAGRVLGRMHLPDDVDRLPVRQLRTGVDHGVLALQLEAEGGTNCCFVVRDGEGVRWVGDVGPPGWIRRPLTARVSELLSIRQAVAVGVAHTQLPPVQGLVEVPTELVQDATAEFLGECLG